MQDTEMSLEIAYKEVYWALSQKIRGAVHNCDDKELARLKQIRKLLNFEMIKNGYEIPGPPHRL